ncbi:MAG TPA: BPSS1780 family membrane protein [Azoarcus sp.]|nr:BPSS1780 family membrane protein [Azoarcus sp.]
MQARQLPLQRGWGWVADGLQLWRRNPTVLIFASFTYMLLLLIVASIPFIGQIAAYMLMPILSLGVLNTCRAIDEGRKPGPDTLFSGFKSNVQQLVTVGGLYLVGTIIVLMITSVIDGGALWRVMVGKEVLDPSSSELPAGLFTGLLIGSVLSLPVLAAYWFAPILVGWWRISAPKAVFFSLYACLQNWRPFMAFGLAIFVMIGLLPRIVIGFAGMVSPLLSSVLLLVLPVVLIPVLFASFYINARDVFGTNSHERLT